MFLVMGLNLYIRAWYNGLSSLSDNCRRRRRSWPKIVRRAQQGNFCCLLKGIELHLIKFDLAKPPLLLPPSHPTYYSSMRQSLLDRKEHISPIASALLLLKNSIPFPLSNGQTIQLVAELS